MKKFSITLAVIGGALAFAINSIHAAALASDDAANYASGTWISGSNLGTGFGAWALTNGTNAGFFIGSSQNNDGGTGNIDSGNGTSFGEFANSGDTSSAVRSFTSGGSNSSTILGVGQGFSLKIDTGTIQATGTVGWGLQNSSGTNRIEVYFKGGASNYTINISGTEFDSGVGFSSAGLLMTFTQNASNGYSLKIGNTTITNSTTSNLGGSDISQFRVFNSNAGTGGTSDQFFNNPTVVPEPSSISLLLGSSFLGCCYLMKRRRA